MQTLESGEIVVRDVKEFTTHDSADIAIGFLGSIIKSKDPASKLIGSVPDAKVLTLMIDPPRIGDEISTFGYPLSNYQFLSETYQEYTFNSKFEDGVILLHHPDGAGMLRNECYETSMEVYPGASGGPVMVNNLVVGIVSSAMDFGGDLISFITPISLIFHLKVAGDKSDTVSELIAKGIVNGINRND